MAENVEKLTEMGFTPEQATQALQQTGGDLSKAVDYLFGDPIEIDAPESHSGGKADSRNDGRANEASNSTGMTSYMDTVNISNPHEIPRIPSMQTAQTQQQEFEQYQRKYDNADQEKFGSYQYIEDDESSAALALALQQEENQQQQHQQLQLQRDEQLQYQRQFEEPQHLGAVVERLEDSVELKDDDCPPVVVLSKSNYLENYLIPVVIILSQCAWFRDLIMINLDEALVPFDSEQTAQSSEQEQAMKFLKEVQHMIYFTLQSSRTKRKFISGDQLINNLPPDFKQALANDIETVDEVILRIFVSMNHNLNLVVANTATNAHFNSIQRTCQSIVESIADDVRSGVYSVEIEPESRGNTLYHTLNGLFWEHNFKKLGLMQYEHVSPVITFHLMGETYSNTSQPGDDYDGVSIRIDETFYPEIYTGKCISTILDMRSEELKLEELRKEATANLLQLNFFEGKKVEKVLKQSLEYLETKLPADDLQDLKQLESKMIQERNANAEQQDKLRQSMIKCDSRNFQNILDHYQQSHGDQSPLNPYQLQGIILSDSRYFVRASGAWFAFEMYTRPHTISNKVVGCNVEAVEFSYVQELVLKYTGRSSSEVTMIYGQETDVEPRAVDVKYLEERFVEQEAEFEHKLEQPVESESPHQTKQSFLPPDSPSSSSASSSESSDSNTSKQQKRQRKNEAGSSYENDADSDKENQNLIDL